MYDTLSDEELARYSERPYNAARFVPRPRGLALDVFTRRAAENLEAACRSEAYVRDAVPSYYVYGVRYVPPHDIAETIPPPTRRAKYLLLGLVGQLDLSRTDRTDVALHERTFIDRVDERVALTDATGMSFAPILVGYHTADHGLNDRLEDLLGLDRRMLSFDSSVRPVTEAQIDGTTHLLWRIDDPGHVEEIARRVRPLKVLVLDGHHRFTAAVHRRDNGRSSAPLTMLVDGRDRALRLLPWHRILPGATVPFPSFVEKAGQEFPGAEREPGPITAERIIERLEAMHHRGRRGFLASHGADLYEFHGPGGGDVGADFDLLHEFLEGRLKVDPHDLLFRRSPRAVLEELASGDGPGCGGTGLFLPPLSEPGIETRSFGGGPVMAQKSTMFLPKVAEGMIFAGADRSD